MAATEETFKHLYKSLSHKKNLRKTISFTSKNLICDGVFDIFNEAGGRQYRRNFKKSIGPVTCGFGSKTGFWVWYSMES